MFDLLRTRLGQGTPTAAVPADEASFPERFRGRPVIRPDAQGRASIDLGACMFSPEEADEEAGLEYTREYRMATRTRDALVVTDGELELATALDARMRKLLGRSLRLRSVVAGSCNGCEMELVASGNVVFDLSRFGVQFVASPRHADGIVITGAVNTNMRDALERAYAAVPDPRIVIAVGACAASG
ncbi:MAG TPA: hypothetical protein VFJ20_13325, partial [Gemmatimonadaceae bacterium]|nr:hypothetical protein [Gemmatimonadaceae bacterium]